MKLDMPELKNVTLHDDIKHCMYCKQGKAKRLPFDHAEREHVTRPLERVHSDTLGPIDPGAFQSAHKYIVAFTDDFSRYAEAYSMFNKTQVNAAFQNFTTY